MFLSQALLMSTTNDLCFSTRLFESVPITYRYAPVIGNPVPNGPGIEGLYCRVLTTAIPTMLWNSRGDSMQKLACEGFAFIYPCSSLARKGPCFRPVAKNDWCIIFLSNVLLRSTVMILNFRADRSGQTLQTQIRLLLEEQSDQGLHCFCICIFLVKYLKVRHLCFDFRLITARFSCV